MTLHSQLNMLESSGLIRLAAARPELEYLFRHALVQETAYASLLKHDRRRLHLMVGESLERINPDNRDELAPTLAYHFERAGARDKAVRYLTLAGERASAAYANREATDFFRAAIEQLGHLLRAGSDEPGAWAARLVELQEKMGDLLELIGQHEGARESYHEALDRTVVDDRAGQSRLHRKVANTWVAQHQGEEAFQAFDVAEGKLGREPTEPDAGWWREWLQIQLDRMWLHYTRQEIGQLRALVERAKPALEQYGSPAQRSKFYVGLILAGLMLDRFTVSEETLGYSRASLAAARESGNPSIIAFAHCSLGFSHLWRGELDVAEEHLGAGLKLGEQIGDVAVQARSLTYLIVAYRKRGEVEQVRDYLPRAMTVAAEGQIIEYIATAKGNRAWVAWIDGDLAEAREQGAAAIKLWQDIGGPGRFCFWWIALWPLLGVALAEGRTLEAVTYARALLDPTQQLLPAALTAALEGAVHGWEQGQPESSRAHLDRSVELARGTGYL